MTHGEGLLFWAKLEKNRPDLKHGCRCKLCRSGDQWQHVAIILIENGYMD